MIVLRNCKSKAKKRKLITHALPTLLTSALMVTTSPQVHGRSLEFENVFEETASITTRYRYLDTVTSIDDEKILNAQAEKSKASKKTEEVSESSATRKPFILRDDTGNLVLSSLIRAEQATLLKMNDLSYSLVKGGGAHLEVGTQLAENIIEDGWKIRLFLGVEGSNNQHLDVAGLVAYNPTKSLMNVVYHGTATIDDGISAGWETNRNAAPIRAEEVNLLLPGLIHKGFAMKYASTKPMMLGLVREYMEMMSKEQKENLQIIFTGHSQAAAVGNLAIHDLALNHGKELFGEDYDNRLDRRLYGYFLSVPRVGNKEYVDSLHSYVGREYLLRQNVHGDPTPIILGNKALGRTVGRFSSFVRNIAVYEDSGYLLLEKGSDVWERANTTELKKGRRKQVVKTLKGAVVEEAIAIGNVLNPMGYYRDIKRTVGKVAGIRKVPFFFLGIASAIKNRIVGILKPVPKASVSVISDLAVTRFAHYHYGYDRRDGRGAIFSTNIVGRDLDKMLDLGQTRED